MAKTRAIVITGNGTNCEVEAAHACRLGGFDEAVIAHISDLLSGDLRLDDFHFLNLTGGFLDGDDLGSAKAQANRFKYARVDDLSEHLIDQLLRFIQVGKPILGVCNGFQLMVKMGLLPAFEGHLQQVATLTFNDCGRFQDRWVYLKNNPASPSIFTRGIDRGIYLPIRHGEGKFVVASPEIMERIEVNNLAVFKYSGPDYGEPTMSFPE
ncbi:MAG TPA: phosphoribosylformylglycinamidine synthase subunit PurQ, partial [Geomobilimonas sp.]|nr:phosphoribosylformylglycinamidine synthase subunit PurQ [Geomobilimonas sp.]